MKLLKYIRIQIEVIEGIEVIEVIEVLEVMRLKRLERSKRLQRLGSKIQGNWGIIEIHQLISCCPSLNHEIIGMHQ